MTTNLRHAKAASPDATGHVGPARRPARMARAVIVRLAAAAAAPVLLFAAGCLGETYVVRQVDGTTVICGEKGTPEKTFTREWDPIVQVAPEVGQEWLCNE